MRCDAVLHPQACDYDNGGCFGGSKGVCFDNVVMPPSAAAGEVSWLSPAEHHGRLLKAPQVCARRRRGR